MQVRHIPADLAGFGAPEKADPLKGTEESGDAADNAKYWAKIFPPTLKWDKFKVESGNGEYL